MRFMKQVQMKSKYFPFLAFVLSASLFLLVLSYSELLGNGRLVVLRSDLFNQYVPFIEMFIRNLKEGNSLSYSWNLGLGSNTSLVYAYYTLSPFNLIFLLNNWLGAPAMVVMIILAKLGLSAAAFQISAGKLLGREHFETVIGGVCYSMCGFAVTYHFHIIWLDALYMLPVIIWLTDGLIKRGRWLLLALAYGYLFTVHFYTGYMAGCFSFLVFILLLIYNHNNDKKQTGLCVLKYFASVILGMLISAVVWLPAGMYLFKNMHQELLKLPEITCTLLDILNGMFIGQMDSLEGVYPFTYSGVFCLLLIPCYFFNGKVKNKEKLCTAFLMIIMASCMLIVTCYRFFHAFENPNWFGYRFIFCFSFLCIMVACRQMILMERYDKKLGIYLVCLYLTVYCIIEYYQKQANLNYPNSYGKFILNAVFLITWLYLLNKKSNLEKHKYNFYILFLILFELGMNSYLVISQMEHNAYDRENYVSWLREEKEAVQLLKEKDPSFYRIIYKNDICLNSPALFDFKGTTVFTSGMNVALSETLKKVGAASNGLTYYPGGMTPFIRMISNIKYRITRDQNKLIIDETGQKKKEAPQVEKLDHGLELGFMTDPEILNYRSDKLNPFENQNELLKHMTGSGPEDLFSPVNFHTEAENAIIDDTGSRVYFSQSTEFVPESYIHIVADEELNREIYGCIRILNSEDKLEGITFTTPDLFENNDLASSQLDLMTGPIIKAGKNGEEPYKISIVLSKNILMDGNKKIEGYYDKAFLYQLNEAVLEDAYQELSKNQLHVIESKNGYIKGEIEVTEDRTIMFTSIPYESGWRLSVDNKSTNSIGLVENTFLGASLKPGKHIVELTFYAPGQFAGKILSLTGLMVWCMMGCIQQCVKRKQK